MELPPEDDVCSVCRGDFNIPFQADCTHWFCGSCIIRFWNHGSSCEPCLCPLCRRQIRLLVPSPLNQEQCPEASHVFETIRAYNRLFGNTELLQKLLATPFLLRSFSRDIINFLRSLPFVIKACLCLFVLAFLGVFYVLAVDSTPVERGFMALFFVFISLCNVAALYGSLSC